MEFKVTRKSKPFMFALQDVVLGIDKQKESLIEKGKSVLAKNGIQASYNKESDQLKLSFGGKKPLLFNCAELRLYTGNTIQTQPQSQEEKDGLAYVWKAIYKDGSLRQYKGEKSYHFGDIKLDRLLKLQLIHREKDIIYEMDYVKGELKIGEEVIIRCEANAKPILFRRIHEQWSGNGPSKRTIQYYLGAEGKKKIGLVAYEDGSYSMPTHDGFNA